MSSSLSPVLSLNEDPASNPVSPGASRQVMLITTLAEYQTVFWAEIGLELQRLGHATAFISFDDRSHDMLVRKGLRSYNAFALRESASHELDDAAFSKWLERYEMKDSNAWFSHERVTFNIRDVKTLQNKLMRYSEAVERAISELKQEKNEIVLIQELGGFLSVIAAYFVARRHGIDNYFIEPSFFRGRLFFLRNAFGAFKINELAETPVSSDVRNYLASTLKTQAIVVPIKDKHQYRSAVRKVINWRNLRRLVEKSFDKYVLGKRQDFGYIGTYVSNHLRMLWNSARLRGCYTPLAEAGKFIYYPLHVPGDMALTLRSPEYFDQLALVEYLARSSPNTHKVVIKEHPAMIGALDNRRLRELLNRYDNLLLLPPRTNNYDVLRAADAIVSVNSKSGAEAALLGKPVIVLGDAFYRNSPLVRAVERLSEAPQLLSEALAAPVREDSERVARYFENVWQATHPGELYVVAPDNVAQFSCSLIAATETNHDPRNGD